MWTRWLPAERYVTKAWQKSKSAEDKHTLDVAKKEVYTAVMIAPRVEVTSVNC